MKSETDAMDGSDKTPAASGMEADDLDDEVMEDAEGTTEDANDLLDAED
jgi:hypothetical protein